MYRVYQPRRKSRLNPIWLLIGINVVLFIATTISPNLLISFGLIPLYALSHPWTLFTSLFLHSSFGHILGNMITLYFFGRNLQALVGARKFLLVYFIGGIVGSLMYVLLAYPVSIAIGASGAIFAVGGALAMLRPKTKVFILFIPIPVPLWAAVIGGCIIMSFLPNVAWQAHVGGLIFGLIMGYFFRRAERRRAYY